MTATFEFCPADNIGRSRLTRSRRPWTLCLGAGINRNVMPDWQELARAVTNRASGLTLNTNEFRNIHERSCWSLDAWIQYSYNAYRANGGNGQADFISALRSELYRTIDDRQNADGLGTTATDAIGNLRGISRPAWEAVATFFDRHFSGTSAYRLANLLANDSSLLPESVINFNADTVFETIFNIATKVRHNTAKVDTWLDPPQTFVRYVRPLPIRLSPTPTRY